MNKKDYRAVAEILHTRRCEIAHHQTTSLVVYISLIDTVARDLCQVFARDNASFDQDKFMRAVQEGK